MVVLASTVLVLVGLCGHTVHGQFRVFRGYEIQQLEALSDIKLLSVAAKTGEAHTVELIESSQAGVVQEAVSLSIDCLPLLSVGPQGSTIRWTFIQLNSFGDIADSSLPPEEIPRNADDSPRPRIVVGGQQDRWLNITSTVVIQGAGDPDSKIFTCEVCENFATPDGCNASNYTQFVIGSPPKVQDTSDRMCLSIDINDSKVVTLECEILNSPLPSPVRSWFKDGELVYSTTSGFTPDLSEYLMDYPILMPGVLDPITLSALKDGSIVYNYEVANISSPALLPPNTTIEQAEQQVFDALLGNWTCIVNNNLGSATIIYLIRECVLEFTITPRMITVFENVTSVQVCISSESQFERNVVVSAQTGPKIGATNQATADLDYVSSTFILTFMPNDDGTQQMHCKNITIIDDMISNEPAEEFSVTLVSASSDGIFIEDTSCITILDNDRLGNTVDTNKNNEIIIAVVVAVVIVIIISLVVSFVILAVIIITKRKGKAPSK